MTHIDLHVDRLGRGVHETVENGDGWQTASVASLRLAELAPLRQALYRLFGAMFLYPSPQDRMPRLCASAREIGQESELWVAFEACGSLPLMLENLPERCAKTGEHVEEEYIRLFQVKPAAPPYQSYYLDREGQARAWIAGQLEHQYAQAGLALSPFLHDLPDHVAVELEFMSFLCGEEVQAWKTNEVTVATKMREMERAFLGQHLGRWFPQFTHRIKDAGAKEPYNGLIDAAYVFLSRELDLLQLRPRMCVS